MQTYANKKKENQSKIESNFSPTQSSNTSAFQFVDNRREATSQRKVQEVANHSQRTRKIAQLQVRANDYAAPQPMQKKANKTGLPDKLKTGIESLSGHSMDDVKVHYNSDKPAQLNAHAYAQGTDIHVATGQEKYLPHEAWHVVQQKQGRVKPTMQMRGKVNVNVNDDAGLEKEADVMGSNALHMSGFVYPDGSDGKENHRPLQLSNKFQQSDFRVLAVQRKIFRNQETLSFQNVYDANGNPFLLERSTQKIMKFKLDQPDIRLEEKGDYYEKLNDRTKENIFLNFSVGRPMNIETEEGEKAQMLPFKDYKFNPGTRHEIAVFKDEKKGELYPEYYNKLYKIFAKSLDNPIVYKFDITKGLESVKKELGPLIYAEEYRTRGAKQKTEELYKSAEENLKTKAGEIEKEYKKCLEEEKAKVDQNIRYTRNNPDPKTQFYKLQRDFCTILKTISSGLPFAGKKGKTNFKKQLEKENKNYKTEKKKNIVWFDFNSPSRDNEKYEYVHVYDVRLDSNENSKEEMENKDKKRKRDSLEKQQHKSRKLNDPSTEDK